MAFVDVPEFGTREPGATYRPRPGAYAIVRDGQGRVAVVNERDRLFLPGGGIDAGETPQEALLREIREECGYHARITGTLGKGMQYYVHRKEGPVAIEATWFTAEFLQPTSEPCETGCELLWMTPEEAQERLYRESERWLVRNHHAAK